MGNYLILNDVNSNTITGLLIQNLPPISKPRQRVNIEEIDGRDGDIITPLGYGAYDKEFQIGLSYNYDVDEIIKYFDSEGGVTFSNEPDKYYNYKIIEQIDYERLIRFKTANVKMHVQPFKYANNEEAITDEFDPITAEGKSMSLNNTVPNTFNEFSIHGNSEQGSTTGKNKLKINQAAGTINGITYTIKEDGSVIINGTATEDSVWVMENAAQLNSDLIAGQSYILSGCPNSSASTYRLQVYNVEGTQQVKYDIGNGVQFNYVETTSANVAILVKANVTVNNVIIKPMIRLASVTDGTYEPYTGGQAAPSPDYPFEIHSTGDSGSVNEKVQNKNLLANSEISTTVTSNGITKTKNADGSMTLSGTATSNVYFRISNFLTLESNTNYTTLNQNGSLPSGVAIYYNNNGNIGLAYNDTLIPAGSRLKSFTTGEVTGQISISLLVQSGKTVNATLYPMLVKGTITNSNIPDYEPYEEQNISIPCQQPMRAIGEYKDTFVKVDGNWYERHYIGQVVLDGSESGWEYQSSYQRFKIPLSAEAMTSERSNSKSNYFIYGNTETTNGTFFIATNNVLLIRNEEYTSVADLKTWLSNNNVELIYVLATPVDLPCTEEQTQALESKKHSYDGQTHISSLDATPAHMKVEVNGDTSVTVTNEGNIYSKPVFIISGSGDISMYLNNSQVFEISLGDEEYITIDIDKMEAYKGSILKNRLVKGNYENCVLETGDNTISFTGAVTGIEISNYSRWI